MSDIAIKFENISKQYRLGIIGTGTISHDLNRWWHLVRGKEDPYLKVGEINDRSVKGFSEYVWALRDINFEVKQGEVLGIIGKNGAGKSTLLKILSRVTSPTTGSIKAKGRIASLLEVGTGFHPELTGRENIYMNGAIMGMTRREITQKLDEIVSFAGIERYIDTPVKRYSSGMTVRLGFAIAAHLEPEILVVDEVLAVGDAEFQKKAIGKMQDVSKGEGRTVLFVSHNMGAVANLCTKLCCLSNGTVSYLGRVDKGIELYLHDNNSEAEGSESLIRKLHQSKYKNDDIFELLDVKVLQDQNTIQNTDNPLYISFKYKVKKRVMGLRIGFDLIDDQSGIVLFRSFHDDSSKAIDYIDSGKYESIAVIPPNLLKAGYLTLSVCIGIHCVRWIIYEDIKISFSIENIAGVNSIYSDPRPGVIEPLIHWENKNI